MKYAQIEWNNGKPYSAEFQDVFFSEDDGVGETRYVFLQQNQLPQRWQGQSRFVIAETGFGLGLNFIVTLKTWLETAAADACLHYISIENAPVSSADIRRLAERWPELQSCYAELLRQYPPPQPGMHLVEFAGGRIKLHLLFDDVDQALQKIDCQADAWYLDGFAPSRNPAMWSASVFERVARCTRVGGTFATYTAAGAVRRGLADAGFVVRKVQGYRGKREMLNGAIFDKRCYIDEQPWYRLPDFRYRQRRVAIVGAGLAGLTAAWALIKRGWEVILLDQGANIAEGASGNPAGLLMPRLSQQPGRDACFYINAFAHAVRCLDDLEATAVRRFWSKTGAVLVDRADRLQRMCSAYAFTEDFIRYVERDATRQVTGIALNSDVLFFVDAGWVDVKLLCATILKKCGHALSYRQCAVSELRLDHGQWTIIDDDNDAVLTAECVIVANAAGAGQLAQLRWLPVGPVRGQLTFALPTMTSSKIRCPISAERYITPAVRGRHVVGASYDPEARSPHLSHCDHRSNIDGINRLVPSLVDSCAELSGRVAFRAVSRDRVPVVGCVPDYAAFESQYHDLHHGRPAKGYTAGAYWPGLYVSTAHGSRGLASCFISGESIAAMVCSEPMPVARDIVDYLSPARFIIRRLKRRGG